MTTLPDDVARLIDPLKKALEAERHARLEAETRAVQSLRALHREATHARALVLTAARLNAQLDLDTVLHTVCEESARTLDVPIVTVSLYDEKSQALHYAHGCGVPPDFASYMQPLPLALYEQFTRQSGPIIVTPDVQALAGLPNAEVYREMDLRTTVGVSMVRDSDLIGRLNIGTVGDTRTFSEEELALLQGLAAQAAQAIANAREVSRRQEAEAALRKHQEQLEEEVRVRTAELTRTNARLQQEILERHQAQETAEQLLLSILPRTVAEQLKKERRIIADNFAEVTVLFADIVDFTALSSTLSPTEMVVLLDGVFSEFDRLAAKYGVEKIKTIGDAYMAVAGLPMPRPDHAEVIAEMALDIQEEIARFRIANQGVRLRIGMHSGPVVAGVIGRSKFNYDLWGDTVNIASRMESHGLADQIQVTEALYERLHEQYRFQKRGLIEVKGKGQMLTYLLLGRSRPAPS